MQFPTMTDARHHRSAQITHTSGAWASPSRLVLSQIRALLSAPSDGAIEALKPIVLRYLHQSPHCDVDAVQERGAVLINALLGCPLGGAVPWANPTNPLPLRLAHATPVYQIIGDHLASLRPGCVAYAARPSAPESGLRRQSGGPSYASTAHEPLVITMLGALAPKSCAPQHLVSIDCNDVGLYSHRQWRALAPAIGTLAALLHDKPKALHMLRTLLSVPSEKQLPLAQAYVCLAPIENLSPEVAEALILQTAKVPPQHMKNYAGAWNREMGASSDRVAVSRALTCLGQWSERSFAMAIDFVQSDPLRTAWLAAALKALSSASPAEQESTLCTVLSVVDCEKITHNLRSATILATVVLATLPAHRKSLALKVIAAMVQMDGTRVDKLAKTLAVAHPQTLALIFEHPLVISASTDLWRQLACLPPPTVRTLLAGWDRETAGRRIGILAALDNIDDIAVRGDLAQALCRLDTNNRQLASVDFDLVSSALQKAANAQAFVTLLQACSPDEGLGRVIVLHGLLGAPPDARAAEDAINLAVSVPVHAFDRYARLVASTPERRNILASLAKLDEPNRAHVMSCIDALEVIDGPGASDGPWLAKAIMALADIEGAVCRSLVVRHLATLQVGGAKTPAGRLRGLVHALASSGKSRRQAWMTYAKVLTTPTMQSSERIEIVRLLQNIATSELKDFVFACRVSRAATDPMSLQHVRQAYRRFREGDRPNLLLGGDVHNATLTARLIEQITTLVEVGPQIDETNLRPIFRSMQRAIDAQEKETPWDHPDRTPREGHDLCMFDEARQALFGKQVVGGYRTIRSNTESFNLHGAQSIRVGTLAARIWRAIDAYPQLAMPEAALDTATVGRDKVGLRMAFVRALASCVENNQRVCYAGKVARLMVPLEGWLRLARNDGQHAPDPSPPAAGDVLSLLSQQAFAQKEAPSLMEIESFVGQALAAYESLWPPEDDGERARFFEHLTLYVDADHDAFSQAYPEFWRTYEEGSEG